MFAHLPAGFLSNLNHSASVDFGRYNLRVAALHSLRRLPAVVHPTIAAALAASPALRSHARIDGGDALFCLAHRHYLARGLGARARMLAALTHYQRIDHGLPARWATAILSREASGSGLVLWSDRSAGPEFRLVLGEGRDATTEGGLSFVLEIDGAPLSVLSFSFVPAGVIGCDHAAGLKPTDIVPFIVRKQSSRNAVARNAFTHRYDRASPCGMTFAGLSAFARLLGHDLAFGIRSQRHPIWSAEQASALANGYDGFWETLGARNGGEIAVAIDLPGHYAPLAAMTAAKRARALRRRAHLGEVEAAATQRLIAL